MAAILRRTSPRSRAPSPAGRSTARTMTRASSSGRSLTTGASAVRAVDGHVADPRAGFLLVRSAAEMGEGLYGAPPPTGYPDRAEAWVNAGALLARMNFALALTQGRLPGVTLDLSPLAVDRAAPDAALERLLAALLHGTASAQT